MGGRALSKLASKMVTGISWLAALACLPGGALWAVSPLGIVLSQQRLQQGSDLFWMLFPAAPLALALGVIGLLWVGALGSGWPARIGAGATLLGLLMVVAGIVGQFWFALDDELTILAPAYYTFRAGLIVSATGSVILGISGLVRRTLPAWGALPFVIAALCGLFAFVREMGTFGSGLWAVFGAGWIWLGFSVVLAALAGAFRERRFASMRRYPRETGSVE